MNPWNPCEGDEASPIAFNWNLWVQEDLLGDTSADDDVMINYIVGAR